MIVGGYSINGYSWLIVLMDIGGYFTNGYSWLIY